MRFVSAFLLLSSVSGIRAALLHNWADSESPTWIPTETGAVKSTGSTTGWTPKPTRAPGFVSEQDQVVGLLRRQRQLTDTTAWVNDRTCGWVAQTPSRAILCGSDFTCATNNANLVACVSGTFSPFFRVCMDFSAVQQGQCSDVGPETGCCDDRISPACATWIWTGNPARSQYGCAARSTIYSVMDIPQFVFDSLTRSTTSSTRPSSSTLSTKTASTTGQSSASQSIQTSLLPTTGGTTGNNLTVGNQTSTTTNLTPIIGGAVGGLAGLILLVLLVWCCLRRRRNKKSTSTVNKSDTKSNTENNTTVNYNVSQENQYTHATTSNTSFNHDKAVANALILEKDADVGNASGGGSNGGGGGGNGAMAAIFCCGAGTRKSKKDKNLEKALQSGRDNAPAHVGMPQSQQQHAVEEHHHHHHYHFDPSANSNTHSRAPSSITAHNSDAGSGFVGPGQQPPARTFSFDVMPQPSHVNHPASLTPHNPYVAGSAGLGLIAPAVVPAMPKHYSHSSPLGISNNSPVPMISELNATPMAGSTTGKYQQHNQHNQPCQQQQQQQQQQHNEKQQQYPLASQIDHGANTQGAQQLASYAAYRPSAPPPLITAINTSDNHASTSSSPAPSSSQAVSPSPLSSTASSLPSLHQLQLQPANGDTVLHALHPPPAQSVRASMYGSFHHVSGGTNGQTGEQRGQHQQQQHCNCCVASHHPRN